MLATKKILLAMPGLTGNRRAKICQYFEGLPITFLTVPSLTMLLTQNTKLETVREISFEEIVGRENISEIEGYAATRYTEKIF